MCIIYVYVFEHTLHWHTFKPINAFQKKSFQIKDVIKTFNIMVTLSRGAYYVGRFSWKTQTNQQPHHIKQTDS